MAAAARRPSRLPPRRRPCRAVVPIAGQWDPMSPARLQFNLQMPLRAEHSPPLKADVTPVSNVRAYSCETRRRRSTTYR